MNIEVKKSTNLVDYRESMEFLDKRVSDVLLGNKSELLWIIEHYSVYTAGTSAKNHELLNKKIKTIKKNRGGKYTYHGPGQKVVYFVLDLNKRGRDIRKLVTNLENCIIKILKSYKIKSYPDKKNIGIWVDERRKPEKIAAIGIRVKKWIAYHGFSLNVSNDLSKYNNIIPCGIRNKGITSMKKLGINNTQNINEVIIENFLDVFH
mgnify:CR=1 FL=1